MQKKVNFLSHFYFSQAKDSPYYTLGSILPDLLRMHNSTWRVTLHIQSDTDEPQLNELLKGWQLHLETDRLFHNSDFFQQHSHGLRQHLRTILSREPFRPFFLAHISLELLLDHLLIRSNRVDTTRFYAHLEQCEPEILDRFFYAAGIHDYAPFYTFYDNFCEIRYVNDYGKLSSLSYAINQIGKRVWKVPFNDQEQDALCRVLEDYLTQMPDYMRIFNSLEGSLKAE